MNDLTLGIIITVVFIVFCLALILWLGIFSLNDLRRK